MTLSIFLLMVLRILLGTILDSTVFKRRLLILGAGGRASRIAKLAEKQGKRLHRCRLCRHERRARHRSNGAVKRSQIRNLPQHVIDIEVSEVVLALEERRNSLPVADLLTIKTTGVHVNDMSSFLERETGRVDLDSVNPELVHLF